MRPQVFVFVFAILVGGFVPSEAPAQRPTAADATEPAAPTPLPTGRIDGAVARPKDSVQHPDLDAAWAQYDREIDAVAKAVETAIEQKLNAAAAAGDLDASLKWKTAGEQFNKDRRIPEGLKGQNTGGPKPPRMPKATRQPINSESSFPVLLGEAGERLAKAYEAVEKDLVRSRDFDAAKKVRSERESLALGLRSPAPSGIDPVGTIDPSLPREAVAFGKHRYMVFSGNFSWPDAKKKCDEMGGHLVTITSPEENAFVFKLSGGRPCWIGMYFDPNQRGHAWVTNEPVRYVRWRRSQPDGPGNPYVGISWANSPEWDDYDPRPNGFQNFICEWDRE
jgi:hypothetical protein